MAEMNNPKPKRGEKLFALFLGGLLLFNFPVLSVFSHDGLFMGVPVLYFYLFSTWLGLIGGAWWVNRRAGSE